MLAFATVLEARVCFHLFHTQRYLDYVTFLALHYSFIDKIYVISILFERYTYMLRLKTVPEVEHGNKKLKTSQNSFYTSKFECILET